MKHSLLLLLVLFPPLCFAQGTLADYQRAQRFLPWNVKKLVVEADVRPHWLGHSHRFWYLRSTPEGHEFILVDPDRGTRQAAFDHARLAAALSRLLGKEVRPDDLPFQEFEFAEGNSAIQFDAGNSRWTCKLADYTCEKNELKPEQPGESPDHRWLAFVRDHNLWLRLLGTGQEVQLTRDGVKGDDYATPLPSLATMVRQGTEDVRQPAAVFWSPDSTRLVTYRMDSRNAARFTSLQFVPSQGLRPRAYTYVYPLPGENLAQAAPIIFDVLTGKRTDVDFPPLQMFFQDGPGFRWAKDSRRFYFQFHQRAYREARLIEADAATGKTRVVIDEKSNTYVDPDTTFSDPVDDGAQWLWTSQRDGWNHIYLYDGKTGQLIRQVTRGPWVVRRIIHVDEKARVVYFLASGRETGEDPYQTHLYRINLDGSGLRRLTPEDADHEVAISEDGQFFVDNYSRPDLAPVSVLRRSSDGQVLPLEKSDITRLLQTGWKFPERFHGKGRDGKTDIYGLIWRPSNFDPTRKYPVIEQIYTGPQGCFVPKTFAAYRSPAQSTAELGFIVVMIDGMGTSCRSRAFHEVSYHNLGDGGIPDHISVLRQMAERYPYMDLTRVGLYGQSAGGYDAAHAMLTHPDFYRVGVSISGNHDHRLDKAWWNELWMGYPVGKNYEEQSNVTLAGNLQGHLLLIHGDIDDNVHPVETMRFVDALIRANKNFDMLIVPNQGHGERGNVYITRRRWDYFVRYLLGVTPPAFQIQPPPPDDDLNGRR